MKIIIPSHLTDIALVDELSAFASRERGITTQLIAHLAEFDARRLYLAAGFPSLFAYCVEVLRVSEAEAYNRIEAARAARKFPVILDRLADGSLNMTTVRLLASHLTADNHSELLAAASGKSRRGVEELLAQHFPRPDVAASIRKLPALRPMPAPFAVAGSTPPATMTPAGAGVTEPDLPVARPPAAASRRPVVAPLAPDRYEIRFTADAETCDMLRLAQDLLGHAVPTADPAETIKRALRVLLEDLARKKFAATKRPRSSRGPAPGSRHVAAKVKRAVWIRDKGRCAYVAKSGHRCDSRRFVEFHHVDPYGMGGDATVRTMELRCRAHNNYEAELFYGRPKPTRSGTSTTPSKVADTGIDGGPATAAVVT
jgi:hypothetical protein